MLRTIWLNLGIYGGMVLGTATGLLLSPLLYLFLRGSGRFSRTQAARMLIWMYGRCWVRFVSLFIPVTLPKETIPSPCVIAVNHASFFDVYFMGGQPNWNVAIAVREWPFTIPFYKPFMLAAGYIKTEATGDAVAQALSVIKNGGSVIFFPEGTRSRDGNLQRFYSGAFKTAVEANVPVIPLCLSGTGDFLPRGSWILRPAAITVSLLPPVYPANYTGSVNPHIAMRKDVKQRMQTHLDTLDKR